MDNKNPSKNILQQLRDAAGNFDSQSHTLASQHMTSRGAGSEGSRTDSQDDPRAQRRLEDSQSNQHQPSQSPNRHQDEEQQHQHQHQQQQQQQHQDAEQNAQQQAQQINQQHMQQLALPQANQTATMQGQAAPQPQMAVHPQVPTGPDSAAAAAAQQQPIAMARQAQQQQQQQNQAAQNQAAQQREQQKHAQQQQQQQTQAAQNQAAQQRQQQQSQQQQQVAQQQQQQAAQQHQQQATQQQIREQIREQRRQQFEELLLTGTQEQEQLQRPHQRQEQTQTREPRQGQQQQAFQQYMQQRQPRTNTTPPIRRLNPASYEIALNQFTPRQSSANASLPIPPTFALFPPPAPQPSTWTQRSQPPGQIMQSQIPRRDTTAESSQILQTYGNSYVPNLWPIYNNQPHGVQHQRGCSASPSPSGSDFDSMSRSRLRQWAKDHGLPHSHNRPELIEQAKSGRPVKVVNKGKKRKGNVGNPIRVDSSSDSGSREQTQTRLPRRRGDASGPRASVPTSYTHSLPAAEDEPPVDQGQAELEDENPSRQKDSHDVGPSTKDT